MIAKLKWTVEFSVDPRWVADGFDLTDARAKAMLAMDLGFALEHELGARVTKYAPATKVAKLQGYKDTKAVERTRREGKISHDTPNRLCHHRKGGLKDVPNI